MATRPCPASVVVLEPAQATPVLERPAAARPTRASGGIEIAPLRGSQGRREAPSTRPSGSRSPSAPRGRVTTKTSSPGFVRFQIRTARAPRPRLGQNPRTLPQAWLVVRVEEAALRARHLAAARARLAARRPAAAPTLLEPAAIRPPEP